MELILVDVPPEVQIKGVIQSGSVYYFAEETLSSLEPHYFIVVNINPYNDTIMLLVCSSSRIDKVKNRWKACPDETLIEITTDQYREFKTQSIINCNTVFEKTKEQLIQKLSEGKLKLKLEMDESIVCKLRNGILRSPVVERRIKALLQT